MHSGHVETGRSRKLQFWLDWRLGLTHLIIRCTASSATSPIRCSRYLYSATVRPCLCPRTLAQETRRRRTPKERIDQQQCHCGVLIYVMHITCWHPGTFPNLRQMASGSPSLVPAQEDHPTFRDQSTDPSPSFLPVRSPSLFVSPQCRSSLVIWHCFFASAGVCLQLCALCDR